MQNHHESLLIGLFNRLARSVNKDQEYRLGIIEMLTRAICYPTSQA